MKVCTALQMRNIDNSAEKLGSIPSIVLMENAAIACVGEICKIKKLDEVLIFCGKGNNAGDGLCIARHLYNKGIKTTVYLLLGNDFKGDALVNYEITSKLGIKIIELNDTDNLDLKIKNCDVVVDAIFGTGIHGEIDGFVADVIDIINNNSKYTLSVDIPSGVDSDNAKTYNACIKAHKTVTFVAYKIGMLLYPGADYVGEVVVSDISIPEYIIKEENININIIDKPLVERIKPVRRKNSHKGDYGKVLIIGGSKGLTGAVVMAAMACVRSGAGLVSAGVPESLNSIFEQKMTEPMTIPLKDTDGKLSQLAIDEIVRIINNFDVCLFGPGIGRGDDIVKILEEILKVSKIPVIIDADGLWAFSKNPSMINNCNCNIIMTPHEKEMSVISKCDIEYVKQNRMEISESFASSNGVTLILKGAHTVVTSPDKKQYININGNSGMATGGSGDVLGGMIASFVARGVEETDASIIGAYLHGLAGDIAASQKGEDSMLPSDIIDCISHALKLPVE